MINKLFIKKIIFLLIILKIDMKLNENLKLKYFVQSLRKVRGRTLLMFTKLVS